MHALHLPDKGKHGGGLKAYSQMLGHKSHSSVVAYRDAAEVVENLSNIRQVEGILTKAAHLAAIHKLPEQDDKRARRGIGGRLEEVVSGGKGGSKCWR